MFERYSCDFIYIFSELRVKAKFEEIIKNKNMSSTLKVNGLTYRTIERDVERLFKKFGKINEVFIPKDKFSGKSRGFAFVR